jgi:hypothetical protein
MQRNCAGFVGSCDDAKFRSDHLQPSQAMCDGDDLTFDSTRKQLDHVMVKDRKVGTTKECKQIFKTILEGREWNT